MTKTCKRCNNEKLLDEFGFQPRNKDGKQTYCKECTYKANQQSKMKHGNKPWHVDGFVTEKDHFNASLEHYAEVFGLPNLIKHKK